MESQVTDSDGKEHCTSDPSDRRSGGRERNTRGFEKPVPGTQGISQELYNPSAFTVAVSILCSVLDHTSKPFGAFCVRISG